MNKATYDDSLKNDIFNICNALGGFERVQNKDGSDKKIYRLGDECLSCLKDLKEYLRLEGQVKIDVLHLLYSYETFNTDLIPILLNCTNLDDKRQNRLALACVELMVIMTWPEDPNEQARDMLEREDEEDDNSDIGGNIDKKLEEYNIRKRKEKSFSKIKELLTARSRYKFYVLKKSEVMRQIYLLLEKYLVVESKERSERDNNIIRHLLNFCRNLLAIDDPPNSESLSKNKRSRIHYDLILEFKNTKLIDLFLKLSTSKDDALEWDIILIDIFYQIFFGVNSDSLFMDIKKETMWKAQKLLDEELAKKERRNNVNPHYKGSVWIINPDGPDLVVHKQKALKGDGLQALDDVKKKKYEKTKPFDEFDKSRKHQILNSHVQDCLKYIALFFLENGFKFLLRSLKKDLINVEYLKQIFLTIKMLTLSKDVCEKWVADELQLEIYRELMNLELITELVREYKPHSHSIGYLQSVIAAAHVLLHLLEKYSKSNKYMECKKSRPRKRKNEKSHTTEDNFDSKVADDYRDESSENEQNQNINYKAIFEKVENKFANEIIVKNYVMLLEEYQEIDSETIKHITMMFFRIARHCHLEAMFFKLSIMEIFYRILNDYSSTKKSLTYPQKDLKNFIEWIVNKLIIQFGKSPLMYVELLFPKNISDVNLLQSGYGYDIETKKQSGNNIGKFRE
ncbi:10035_t:CDS:2 [Funneliformis geosporum]|nr:10035_t:CDS:2 [Funneliformis geosporum]